VTLVGDFGSLFQFRADTVADLDSVLDERFRGIVATTFAVPLTTNWPVHVSVLTVPVLVICG
jgi:hypothetical protein